MRTQVNKKLKMFNSKFPDKVSEFEREHGKSAQ